MISIKTIALTVAAAVGASFIAVSAVSGTTTRQATEVVVTPGRTSPTKGAHVFYDDGRKLFISSSCKADIVAAGIPLRPGTTDEVKARATVPASQRDTCAEIIADFNSPPVTTTTAPATTTTTAPTTTTTAPATTTTSHHTTTTTSTGNHGPSIVLYVTPNNASPTKGGFVVTDQQTRTYITATCKAGLLAAGIPTQDAVWQDISPFPRDNSITCEQMAQWLADDNHHPDPGDQGWVTIADESSTTYTDGRTAEKYFFFDPDNHDDPTWGPTRIGWLVECDSVKFEQIDPMVNPGGPSHHLHEFFGNGNINHSSVTQDFADTPQSEIECTDVNDKSAYWSPAVYQDGQLLTAEGFKAYYKSTTPDAVAMPLGLRMVAGNAGATGNQNELVGWFEEQRTNDLVPKEDLTNTRGATEMIVRQNSTVNMVLRVNFPNCWDGVHLDSPDHQSHMAYFDEETLTCPGTHPVKIPQLTTFTQYDADGGAGFSLSSGEWYTFHQDFWNAWSPDQMSDLNEQCIVAELNCRVNGSNALQQRGQYSGFVPDAG